ncbi:MAG: paraquat-inducible protein A [Deltaproteobacteria bacterium]|nr:paraquat-inducible protein A [Deltaproteobacteria bacterium]MBW2415109.1 paraquat-inducible protein A [Deltaproteobacteria bacterium]
MSAPATAAARGLIRCHGCERLSRRRRLGAGASASCSRCGTLLQQRQPDSLSRTWALVIAAYICYVPANLYPVMVFSRLGQPEGDTILSGVQVMFEMGWWAVGGLIFFASIVVPMAKLLSLTGLLLSVQWRSSWRPRERTVLYRVVEYIGRWSMLDMFVVSLMVALIQLGAVATMEPGIGATFFAAVVILTLLAALSFDPRLIWDQMEERE